MFWKSKRGGKIIFSFLCKEGKKMEFPKIKQSVSSINYVFVLVKHSTSYPPPRFHFMSFSLIFFLDHRIWYRLQEPLRDIITQGKWRWFGNIFEEKEKKYNSNVNSLTLNKSYSLMYLYSSFLGENMKVMLLKIWDLV